LERAPPAARLARMERQRVEIRTEAIAVDALLKFAGIAGTGGEAKFLVQSGRVLVNGTPETRRGRRLGPGDRVRILDEDGAAATELEIAAAPGADAP
jgi:ribosome-associated protein